MSLAVFAPQFDKVVLDVNATEAARMVARGQARFIRGGRALRLAEHYELPPDPCGDGRHTQTSRGEILGAIGRSQHYTIEDSRGRVHDFKYIAPADLRVFQAAALGADV